MPIPQKMGIAQTIAVPTYDDLKGYMGGAANSPCDFLPTMVDKLPDD